MWCGTKRSIKREKGTANFADSTRGLNKRTTLMFSWLSAAVESILFECGLDWNSPIRKIIYFCAWLVSIAKLENFWKKNRVNFFSRISGFYVPPLINPRPWARFSYGPQSAKTLVKSARRGLDRIRSILARPVPRSSQMLPYTTELKSFLLQCPLLSPCALPSNRLKHTLSSHTTAAIQSLPSPD